jgi:hypothetical protein
MWRLANIVDTDFDLVEGIADVLFLLQNSTSMIGENQQLLTHKPVESEK